MSKGKRRKRAYCKECNRIKALDDYYVRKQNPDYILQRKHRARTQKLKNVVFR